MKISSILFALCIAVLLPFGASAQTKPTKLGYVNVELILGLMPEAKQLEGSLRTHEQKVMQQLEIKKSYLEGKIAEYRENEGKMTAEARKAAETDITKLNEEIQKFTEEAQRNYEKKKDEQLAPIVEKLQKAIDEVADAEGYTYIFNANIGGNSILIKGPKEDNITLKVIRKLNIQNVPKEIEDALNGIKPGATPTAPADKK